VKRPTLAKRTGKWLDPIASLRAEIVLRPGEDRTVCFTLGLPVQLKRRKALRRNTSLPNGRRKLLPQCASVGKLTRHRDGQHS